MNSEHFAFTSRCPKCGRLDLQPEFTREQLLDYIKQRLEFDAHCRSCGASYPVAEHEREALAMQLGACGN